MDVQVKQRIVGASVLCALAVIIVPMLFDDSEPSPGRIEQTNIPEMPAQEFSSRIVPLDESAPPAVEVAPMVQEPDADTDAAPSEDNETQGETGKAAEQAAGQRVGLTAWAVQLGSFGNEENARALESRLRQGGHSAFVEKLVTDTDTVFRVRVGPELLRDDARKLRDQLAKEVELEGIVVRYP